MCKFTITMMTVMLMMRFHNANISQCNAKNASSLGEIGNHLRMHCPTPFSVVIIQNSLRYLVRHQLLEEADVIHKDVGRE